MLFAVRGKVRCHNKAVDKWTAAENGKAKRAGDF